MRDVLPLPLVILGLAAPALAGPATFGSPHLQGGTATRMGVVWLQPPAGDLQVEAWPEVPGLRARVSRAAGAGPVHWLDGLMPGQAYRYTCRSGRQVVASGTFRTLPVDPDAPLRFAVVGDTGSGAPMQFDVARAMVRWRPDFILHTGDVMYEHGELSGYGPRYMAPYADLVGRCVVYPSIGNHDHRTERAAPYLAFFEPPRARPSDSERWYTFTAGGGQFFALDTNVPFAEGSEQHAWLSRALVASKARWKVAFFHHPPYSGGAHGSSPYVRAAWGPLFERHDVRVVFNGHDHHYERSTPREDFVRDGRPTTYFVTGGGGAWLRRANAAQHTAFQASVHHFLGVTVRGGKLLVEAIDTEGATFDASVH
ncbi:MAG: metallophosphoesterase [Candidatus Sericytochromatia bacterium]|nr:metallophosphoesterase [Candidatus Sericytochromatia bacterium]